MIQNRVGSESFLWPKQLNYDITAILRIWINTYVNPAELGKQKVFLHVWKRQARTRLCRNICADTLTIKAYSKIVFLAVIM